MILNMAQDGLSILETPDLLELSQTTVSIVFREWVEKEKISIEQLYSVLLCSRASLRLEADELQQQETTKACYSCQLRTGNCGCHSDARRLETSLLGLMILDFC